MSHRFDATLKSIVADRPLDFASAFGLPSHGPVVPINVDLSTVSAATDVALAYGDPMREIVDLNFQTGPDPGLPGRLLLYNAALYSRYSVPVRSLLVLLRKKADAANLTGKLGYGESESRVEFHYRVVRLWEFPVEDVLQGGIASLPLATLCRMPADQPMIDALRTVVQEIDRRLDRETNHAVSVRLMTAAYILTGLRVAKTDLAAIYRGIGLMQESTAYDEAVEEGERRGEARGTIRASQRLLFRQGRKQFGIPDASIEAELRTIEDPDRLDRLADAMLSAESWQELLATL
jgi:predicted transposase YdaD